jgi:hypothetical protein
MAERFGELEIGLVAVDYEAGFAQKLNCLGGAVSEILVPALGEALHLADDCLCPLFVGCAHEQLREDRLDGVRPRDLVAGRLHDLNAPAFGAVEAADFLRNRQAGRLAFDNHPVSFIFARRMSLTTLLTPKSFGFF